jgi:hypothetical protein
MKSDGKEYEHIVAEIHRQFSPGAQVTENEKINGRQVDVCIRSVAGPYPVLTIVECKDYRRTVGVQRVDELVGKMEATNANQAVLVSDSGFSKGAINRAKSSNGRIQLASVVDIKNKNLKSKIKVPFLVEYRRPVYQFRFSHTDVGNFVCTPEDVIVARQRFISIWNDGKLDSEPGEREVRVDTVDFSKRKVQVICKYVVKRRLYFNRVTPEDTTGVYNTTEKTYTTNRIDSPIIDPYTVETEWQKVDENNIPKAAFHLVALDVFPLPTSAAND